MSITLANLNWIFLHRRNRKWSHFLLYYFDSVKLLTTFVNAI